MQERQKERKKDKQTRNARTQITNSNYLIWTSTWPPNIIVSSFNIHDFS